MVGSAKYSERVPPNSTMQTPLSFHTRTETGASALVSVTSTYPISEKEPVARERRTDDGRLTQVDGARNQSCLHRETRLLIKARSPGTTAKSTSIGSRWRNHHDPCSTSIGRRWGSSPKGHLPEWGSGIRDGFWMPWASHVYRRLGKHRLKDDPSCCEQHQHQAAPPGCYLCDRATVKLVENPD